MPTRLVMGRSTITFMTTVAMIVVCNWFRYGEHPKYAFIQLIRYVRRIYAADTLALSLFESKFIATLPTKITVPTITTSGPAGTFT